MVVVKIVERRGVWFVIDIRLGGLGVGSCEDEGGSEVRPVRASVVCAHSRAVASISDWLISNILSNDTTVVDGCAVTTGKELTEA